jgi:hypothetical protein
MPRTASITRSWSSGRMRVNKGKLTAR